MNGAESLTATATAAGINVCFANPGTTEIPLVRALDGTGGIRSILGLFEGVCTGAADGYGRMAGRPALTLLHLGPGLANGLANLHNARRARTPVVNLVGDQATYHLPHDAPLTSDIISLARPVSGWVRSASSAATLAAEGAEAIAAAQRGQGATLIVPADCQWDPAGGPVAVPPPSAPERVAQRVIDDTAKVLRCTDQGVLLLGGTALSERGLRAAARAVARTGWRLMRESFPARLERGGDLPSPNPLPYLPEQASRALAVGTALALAGARAPVAFFAYPGMPSSTVPTGMPVHLLAEPGDDVVEALERLADCLGGGDPGTPTRPHPQPATGPLTPESAGETVAALQPEGAIVVEEGVSSGLSYTHAAPGAPRHTALGLTGGAIGQGLPCATGAAVACPDRPVIALQADGSGMYTVQALWTQAREQLDVTTLIYANHRYRILQFELLRAGAERPGPASAGLTGLDNPRLDWVQIAEGMGVPAARATTAEDLAAQFYAALADPGPHLIEMVL
ncbi:MAG: acetolactate synthase large subunit [Nitriliruptorales bacterium]|nr:acetolactate synthase large subunit [Nitriliruptorales bacterium]